MLPSVSRPRRFLAVGIGLIAMAVATLTLGVASAAAADPGPFIGVPGAQLYANGGPLSVNIEGGSAADLDKLYLELYVTDVGWENIYIGDNRQGNLQGYLVWNNHQNRGKRHLQQQLDPTKELIFYIKGYLPGSDSADFVFFSGPGWRNATPCINVSSTCVDGQAHAAVRDLGNGLAEVGFEDLPDLSNNIYWISDWDFNDLVFTVEGASVAANRGFITGGGWLDSPAGTYFYNCSPAGCNDTGSGKATFGFVSKYNNSSDQPNGNIELNLHFGNKPKFHASNLYWLDVEGPRARVRGTGSLGGNIYDFLMTVVDGKVAGGGTADRFRMNIWDTYPFRHVYYNGIDNPDLIQSVQAIADGSIVMHK